MTVAASDATFANDLAQRLSGMNFRAYTSADMVGVETGGAIKNVLAIGAGISDGLGFGANTRIALITRGLVEMTRLGVALGAHKDTFMGLAGLGDLVLTCTDNQSRNRRWAWRLHRARARRPHRRRSQVVEACAAVRDVAARCQWNADLRAGVSASSRGRVAEGCGEGIVQPGIEARMNHAKPRCRQAS
jgi:glycerol-3-phosphate dehydrogenase (NAD(P)+)